MVPRDKIERALSDHGFGKDVDGMMESPRAALAAPAWFQQNHAQSTLAA